MCLLIAGKASEIRTALLNTPGLIENIFKRNNDGVGAMYTSSRKVLRTPKVLPNTVAEAIAFIQSLPQDDRNLALHWRMRTHGDTDLENCHPYSVIDGKVALMHNGVLSQGNHADKSKSDTWHYIADVVRPMLELAPKMFMNMAWATLVASDISRNNRFAIMDNEGALMILNKHTGIDVQGMWFSNTYAWDPALLIPDYNKPKTYNTSTFSNQNWKGGRAMWDDNIYGDDYVSQVTTLLDKRDADEKKKDAPVGNDASVADFELSDAIRKEFEREKRFAEDVNNVLDGFAFDEVELWESVSRADVEVVTLFLEDYPYRTLSAMYTSCEFVVPTNDREYSVTDGLLVEHLEKGDILWLAEFTSFTSTAPTQLAQAMCWYGDWCAPEEDETTDIMEKAAKEIKDELDAQIDAATAGGEDGQVRPRGQLTLVKPALWRGNQTPVVEPTALTPSQMLAASQERAAEARANRLAREGAAARGMTVLQYELYMEQLNNIADPVEDEVLTVTTANMMH